MFFEESKLLTNQERILLTQWIDANFIRCHLIYAASIHGKSLSRFHEKTDNKGPTMSILKSDEGKLFGCFTTICFNSQAKGWMRDDSAFLCSISEEKKAFNLLNN